MANKRSNTFFKGFDYSRKMEVVGILIMSISVLLLLSIASYHPDDYSIVKSLSYDTLLEVDEGPALRVNNWLGVFGAYISYFFVNTLFGYVSILIPVIIFGTGWFIFRQENVNELSWPVAYGLWMVFLISTMVGWFYTRYETFSMAWSGNSGIYFASLLQNFTGIGSIFILFVLLFISFLILIDRDIQKTIDRVNDWSPNFSFPKIKRDRQQAESNNRSSGSIKKQRQAEEAYKSEASKEREENRRARTIDEIVERSQEVDRERELERKKESAELEKRPPRAVLEKASDSKKTDIESEEDDVEISVIVGEGDEEASEKELDRKNKEKAKVDLKFELDESIGDNLSLDIGDRITFYWDDYEKDLKVHQLSFSLSESGEIEQNVRLEDFTR